jgi:hypothetical protein
MPKQQSDNGFLTSADLALPGSKGFGCMKRPISPPCQQGDGGDEQTQESDFLHVLDGMLRA